MKTYKSFMGDPSKMERNNINPYPANVENMVSS
jgi:hypothetical protein